MGSLIRPGGEGGLFDYGLMFAGCAVTAFLAARLNVPGGMMLGALIGSAVLHGANVVTVSLPAFLALPSLVLLGIIVGARLSGIDAKAFGRLLVPSLGCFALSLLGTGLARQGVVRVLRKFKFSLHRVFARLAVHCYWLPSIRRCMS